MEQALEIAKWILAHYQEILSAVSLVLMGVIAICILIPGDQPEKALQAIVDVIAKISRKPKDPSA